jgi:hypothetical protein
MITYFTCISVVGPQALHCALWAQDHQTTIGLGHTSNTKGTIVGDINPSSMLLGTLFEGGQFFKNSAPNNFIDIDLHFRCMRSVPSLYTACNITNLC